MNSEAFHKRVQAILKPPSAYDYSRCTCGSGAKHPTKHFAACPIRLEFKDDYLAAVTAVRDAMTGNN